MECCQKICDREADFAVHWPSPAGPCPMCTGCAMLAAKLARVMGFELPVGSLDPLIEPLAQQVEEGLQACPHGRDHCEDCDVCMGRGIWKGVGDTP